MKKIINRCTENSKIKKFLMENPDFTNQNSSRALYLATDTEDIYIFEYDEYHNKKVFILEYSCGILYRIRTEYNNFEKHLELISKVDFAEYITF